MATLTRSVLLSENLFKRIRQLKKGVGIIYGFASDEVLEAIGFALCQTKAIETKVAVESAEANIDTELSECISYTQSSLPAGMGIIGHILVEADGFLNKAALESSCSTLMNDALYSTDTPLMLIFKPDSGMLSAIVTDESFETEEAEYKVVNHEEMLKPYLTIRLRGQLNVGMENSVDAIADEFAEQLKKVISGVYTFHFAKSGAYLNSSEEEGICGISADKQAKHLSGKSDDGKKKKKSQHDDMEVIEASLFVKPSKFISPDEEDPIMNCAPIIQHKKREQEIVKIPIKLDGLSIVPRDSSIPSLYGVLVESLRRQLVAAESCIISELGSRRHISPPQPFHFNSVLWGHFLTMSYPRDVPDSELTSVREKRHDIFALPTGAPLFRRGCKQVFSSDLPENMPLINPHEGLQDPSLRGCPETGLVQGRYSYHHYMQDGFDDNGWGCAYRSLQTVVSWFRWQGYTDAPVPSHRDVQKCLVDIGDKPSTFVGSRQWIGSTEVSFCLETLLGVTSRIMSVSSGEELCTRGDELLRHFQTQGTPIMVGGGVLAHTILGVKLERENEEIRFLVLDPHYTAGEDLSVIQSKGWCGWKGPDFWMKTAFYNLCMPQRPLCL